MTAPFFTLLLSLPAAPAPAPKIDPPKGPPPRITMISAEGEDKFALTVPVYQNIPVTETVTVPDNQGRNVQVQRTVMVQQTRMVKQIMEADKVSFYGLDGKKIEVKDVRKLVPKPVPALVSSDGKPVDRFYLQLAKRGTLVLVLPSPSAAVPGGFAPAPRPLPVEKEKLPPQRKKET
jgi:hypothetical protein